MAIVKEPLENNLILHYSANDKYIRQVETGVLYVDAVDTVPCAFTYEETDEDIYVEEA